MTSDTDNSQQKTITCSLVPWRKPQPAFKTPPPTSIVAIRKKPAGAEISLYLASDARAKGCCSVAWMKRFSDWRCMSRPFRR
jgi:hypothetical protein